MGVDSDATTKTLDQMGKPQRAAAQKRSGDFDPPPESPAVKAQRSANDRRGRDIDPWRK